MADASGLLVAPAPLVAAVRRIAGPGVAVAGGRIADWQGDLWPCEEPAVARARPARRAEFAAGRAAARAAMASLGVGPLALPRRADGPPLWPAGLTGSLAHGGGHVLAVVARRGPGLRALGIDVEAAAPLPRDLAAEVCRAGEDASSAIRVFGAKEAAYKAQFMLTGRLLDFAAMWVRLDASGGFRAELLDPVAARAAGRHLSGHQALAGPLLVSMVRVPCGAAIDPSEPHDPIWQG